MFHFPWTNFHELNLDWILQVVKHAQDIFTNGEADIQHAVDTAEEAKEIATQAAEAQVADNSISTPKLQDSAVTTVKIADGAVTGGKIAANAVTAGKIATGAVTENKIADGAVTLIKLGPDVIDRIEEIAQEVDSLNIIVVDWTGNGDYTTISDAVDHAANNDIILVKPGTYTESVHAYNANVHIIGVDKRTTILTYSAGDYYNPPLEIARGSVSNMTINATNTGTITEMPAYAVHIDNDNSAASQLTFRNCRFYNAVHQGVGVGLRKDFNLTFELCEFEAVGRAALYCHDWETNQTSVPKSPQVLNLYYCTLFNLSNTEATVHLQSQELETDCATFSARYTNIINRGGAGRISMTMWNGRTLTNNSFMGSSDWRLSPSAGFTNEALINGQLSAYPINQYNLNFYKNIVKHYFNSSTPLTLSLNLYEGCLLLANLQGVGFKVLAAYHGASNTSYLKDVFTGADFTSTYYSWSVTATTFVITSTASANSYVTEINPKN